MSEVTILGEKRNELRRQIGLDEKSSVQTDLKASRFQEDGFRTC